MNAGRTVAAAILLVACGGEEPVVSIENFSDRSPLVQCAALRAEMDALASVTTLRPISDTTLLVVDGRGSRIAAMHADGRELWSTDLPAEGPASVGRILDAAASGDSLVVVADGGRNRLVAMSHEGRELWTIELGFPPQSIAFAGGRLLIAALGMDPRIPGLVHEVQGQRVVPRQVPFITHPDALARMFANSVSLYGFADGSALAAHEMIWPTAWSIPPAGDPVQRQIPVPEGPAKMVGYIPPMPIAEDDLGDIVVPVISLAADERSGHLLYLTRSGNRTADGGHEKAIVLAAADFTYLGSVRLPMNATEVAYLAGAPDSVYVVDADLVWHRCPVPATNSPT